MRQCVRCCGERLLFFAFVAADEQDRGPPPRCAGLIAAAVSETFPLGTAESTLGRPHIFQFYEE
jgi:hypothetical protein